MNEMEHQKGLPHQLIIDEILTRLPVKSLCRFKSVSELWNAVISSDQFVKAHLNKQQFNTISSSNLKGVHFQDGEKSYMINFEACDNEENSGYNNAHEGYQNPGRVLLLQELLNDHLRWVSESYPAGVSDAYAIGSSCGLICVYVAHYSLTNFCIFNPSLHQCRTVPTPVQNMYPSMMIFSGFGYVSSIDDFKLVLVLTGKLEGERTMIYMFSLRNNDWRTIEEEASQFHIIASSTTKFQELLCHKGILVNESLHWWTIPRGNNSDGRIFTFDLVHEVFGELLIPEELSSKVPDMFSLSEFSDISEMGGCLCLSVFWNSKNVDIWMLKQYRETTSWVKVYNLSVPECYIYNSAEFYGFTKAGKFVMSCLSTSPVGHDTYTVSPVILLVNPNLQHPMFHSIWADHEDHISCLEGYVESLVSPFGLGTERLGDTRTEEGIMKK